MLSNRRVWTRYQILWIREEKRITICFPCGNKSWGCDQFPPSNKYSEKCIWSNKESFLEVHYNLDDSFCDAKDLKQSWRQTKVPDVLMTFFSVLMNWGGVKLYEMIVKQDKFPSENISNDEENDRHRSYFKVKSLVASTLG